MGRLKDLPPVPQPFVWLLVALLVLPNITNWFVFLFLGCLGLVAVVVYHTGKEWIDDIEQDRNSD